MEMMKKKLDFHKDAREHMNSTNSLVKTTLEGAVALKAISIL